MSDQVSNHRRPLRRLSRRSAGFTLLETILAIALSALLMAVLAGGMRIYTRLVSDRRADVVNAQLARVVMQQMRRDIQSTFYEEPSEDDGGGGTDLGGSELDGSDEGGDAGVATETIDTTVDLTGNAVQPTPGIYGNATELQIDMLGRFAMPLRFDSLTAAGVDPMSANLLSDPKVITYYLREIDPSELAGTPLENFGTSQAEGRQMVLIRRVQSRAQAIYTASAGLGSDLAAGEQLMTNQVVNMQFAYHDGYDWVDTWDSSLAGLPIAVNITLTIVDETATDTALDDALTTDNVFQMTVRLPTAELPEDETATGF